MRPPLAAVRLGRQPYGRVHRLQHALVEARQRDEINDVALFLEHEPVITLGRRADASHIVVEESVLTRAGIEVVEIERGGDVTYHGPGQLVGYPIVDLSRLGLGPSDYMHALEDAIIAAVGDYGIAAGRRHGQVGVWVEGNKICALGVRVSKRVTYHGFALNVDPNMDHWRMIVPCGIRDGFVTSVAAEMGCVPAMDAVVDTVVTRLSERLGLTPTECRLSGLLPGGALEALLAGMESSKD
jgi:lipoate-protein ligase B